MRMTKRNETPPPMDDAWIDDLLGDAARAAVPAPPDALLARVLDDAYTVQAAAATTSDIAPAPAQPVWRQFVQVVGGWGGVGGLVAATCAGFVIGVWSPDFISTPVSALVGDSSIETTYAGPLNITGFGWDLEEG